MRTVRTGSTMRTIRNHIDTRAASQPDRAYLIAPETGQTLTYAALKTKSEALTRYLGYEVARFE